MVRSELLLVPRFLEDISLTSLLCFQFRLGVFLFIPAYLTTPLLRAFASSKEDGSPFLMTALVLNMAARYAGGVFSYTAVMVSPLV